MSARRARVLSVGSVNADMMFLVHGPAQAAKTGLARGLLRLSGGKAANRAVQAVRLGADAQLFGSVGDDDLAGQALAGPTSAGVDVSGVEVTQGATGVAAILVDDHGEKSITWAANANDAWPTGYAARVREAVAAAPAGSVLTCDLEVTIGALEVVLQTAGRQRIPVVLDPSPPERAKTVLLALAHHVTPNANEAGDLARLHVDSPAVALTAGREIVARGAGAAYVKLRGGGCVVVERGDAGGLVLESPEVPVLDATGAGDAFAGALAVALAEHHSPAQAAAWAVAASTCSVGRRGSQESYAGRDEIERIAEQIRRTPLVGTPDG